VDNRLVLPGASDLVTGDVLPDLSFAQAVKLLDGTADSLNAAIVDSSGRQLVGGASTPTDAVAAASAVLAESFGMVWNGASWDRLRTPNVFKVVSAVAVTAGTPASVWTPTSGKKFRLLGFVLSLSVAGFVKLIDSAAEIFRTGAMPLGDGDEVISLGNGILSALANNILKIDVSATGTVNGTVFGVEE
jgi:hypothetical protein